MSPSGLFIRGQAEDETHRSCCSRRVLPVCRYQTYELFSHKDAHIKDKNTEIMTTRLSQAQLTISFPERARCRRSIRKPQAVWLLVTWGSEWCGPTTGARVTYKGVIRQRRWCVISLSSIFRPPPFTWLARGGSQRSMFHRSEFLHLRFASQWSSSLSFFSPSFDANISFM